MIGKIVKGGSFKRTVSYALGKEKATLLASEGVLDINTKSIINSFYMQSLQNPKLSKSVGHIPLAFSPDDSPRMTDQFMAQLAKEYARNENKKHPVYYRSAQQYRAYALPYRF